MSQENSFFWHHGSHLLPLVPPRQARVCDRGRGSDPLTGQRTCGGEMHLCLSSAIGSFSLSWEDKRIARICLPGSHCGFLSQIVGDAVGWGFVVRGSKPCHIQAVDPSGPAAAAGMKVALALHSPSDAPVPSSSGGNACDSHLGSKTSYVVQFYLPFVFLLPSPPLILSSV